MIEGHEKFRLQDKDGKYDLFAEVNWKDDPKIKECKVIKFELDGKTAYINRDNLLAMLFAIGRPEDQRKMIPQKQTKVKWYETVVGVKATKDIHKGETITFPLKISLPAEEKEIIGEVKKKSSFLIK